MPKIESPGSEAIGVTSSTPVAELPAAMVMRWVEAFNRRDIDGLLACVSQDVNLHPLALPGFAESYRGHDGVREWLGRVQEGNHQYQVVLDAVREVDEGTVFASGVLMLAEDEPIGPVCALHRIEHGLIAAAHEYHSDPDTMECIGMIPRPRIGRPQRRQTTAVPRQQPTRPRLSA